MTPIRQKPVIAIDGPSGAGKSTVARGLALKINFAFVDTGAIYRTVAMVGKRNGIPFDDGLSLARAMKSHEIEFDKGGRLFLDGALVGDQIRTPEMSAGASAVARNKEVRDALLTIQRTLGKSGGVVLEGRDIGTVVFPDAEVKFFLTASVSARAKRRWQELVERGESIEIEQVERDQEQRDKADAEREIAPLKKAHDAIEVICDNLSAQEVVEYMANHIKSQFSFD